MHFPTHAWEHSLLSLAAEARHPTGCIAQFQVSAEQLAQAYEHCQQLTALHSRSFYWASALLPPAKRQAVRALYAFCRTTDDIVDKGKVGELAIDVNSLGAERLDPRAEELARWRQQLNHLNPQERDPVTLAWTDARLRYRVPLRYAEQLIDGVARDLVTKRYATFTELAAYCYGVASTVGLMSMHIIGFAGPHAIPYAIKLGVALQLTNILRDVAEDWRAGRVYLPQTELAQFGLSETAIGEGVATGKVDDRWRALMRFQIARNRRLYEEARPGFKFLEPDGRLAIAAAADLYRAILADIERHDYDVFTRRAQVGSWGKLRRLPGIWWRVQWGA